MSSICFILDKLWWSLLRNTTDSLFGDFPFVLLRSSKKLGSSQAASMESSSLTGSLSLASDVPHCQCCISYEARLKRLSCGHLYCDPCSDQIVNLAFEDIEGLAEYPCPMCKSLRQLSGLHGFPGSNFTPYCSPFGSQKQRLVEDG